MGRRKRNKLWSVPRISDPRYPDYQVRITELSPGGNLYVVRMVEGKQRMASLGIKRKDLGSTAKEQVDGATAQGLAIIEELAKGGGAPPRPERPTPARSSR